MAYKRTGGRVLIQALENNGIDHIFGVPGESYLEALDALYDGRERIRYITCRQEGGASYMAEAYARLSGLPGVCFVTRGPGATNASIGVHTAYQSSTPYILLVGQVPRDNTDREAFQEIDYRGMFGQMAKWVAQIENASRIPEYIHHAFKIALSGRPGPVVLALPEDMLRDVVEVEDMQPAKSIQTYPGSRQLAQLKNMLEQSRRPLFIVGGSIWTDAARLSFEAFADRNNLPVSVAFRRQGIFDAHHDSYCGDLAWGPIPSLRKAVEEADLIVSFGARLNEGTTSKYSLPAPPKLNQALVHIYADAEALGHVYHPDLMIHSGVCEMAEAFGAMGELVGSKDWASWRENLRTGYIQALDAGPQPGELDMNEVMKYLREHLPKNAIVTTGAGNYADWPNKTYTYCGVDTNLSPISGAMGYSVPSAVCASITRPDRLAVGFAGDGDFLMNGQELAVARQYGGKPIIIVINNSLYGTIRMHQQSRHPGRISGTQLWNPNFAAYAHAFDAYGEVVETTDEFAPAFERALDSGKPAVLELRIDPECICYGMPKLSDIPPL
jgi:acetolactate synthase-1/2/3 large subunit